MLLIQEDTSDPAPASPTAGQLLKAARQAKGVHLAVLAVTLKVPVRQLEALEAGQYEALKGGPTFLRAVASSMCRQLGIDSAPVLALLPSAVLSMGGSRAALEPLSRPQRVSFRPSRAVPRSARPVLVLSTLMLMVTAAFLWLPSPEAWWPGLSSNEPPVAAVEESAVPLGQASNPESTEDVAEAAPAASASAVAGSAPVLPAQAASTPVAPVTAASPAILRLDASADTWVEVRDAKGQPVGKLLKAGESMEVNQPTPYSVVIGRGLAVKASLRGQPLDLKPHTAQTVARFEVKE